MNIFNFSFIEKILNTIMQKLNNSFAYKLLKKWNLTFEADYVRVNKKLPHKKAIVRRERPKLRPLFSFHLFNSFSVDLCINISWTTRIRIRICIAN
jgi:hypothetical protein